jgi:polysaccharide biosynthesis transport protein
MSMHDGATERRERDQAAVSDGEARPILAALLDVLRRRRLLLIGGIAGTLLVATLAFLQITPRYTAEATVMVYPREERVVDIDAVVSRLTADDQAVQSEMRVIESPDLARRVIAELDLDRRPELNTRLRVSLLERILAWAESPWLSAALGDIVAATPDEQPDGVGEIARVVDRFRDRLDVRTLGRSRVIAIAFTSEDPRLAARIANTLADRYIAFQLETKLEATRHASDWLGERLETLRDEVEAAERAVEDFRARIIEGEGHDTRLLAQRLGETNSQLVVAGAEAERARARLARIEELVALSGPTAVFDLIEPQHAMWLNEQLIRLHQTEAELTARHGDDHPVVVGLRARIEAMREETARRLISAARNEVRIAEARAEAHRASLAALLDDSVELGRAEVRLRALEREAEAGAELLRTFLNRAKETAQVGLERPDALIVSRASAPAKPSHPRTLPFLAIALAGSMVVGFGLVFAAEELETGYRTLEKLAGGLGVRGLASVPAVRSLGRRTAPAELPLDNGYLEAVRALHLGVTLALPAGDRGRVVQITSSVPKEGKTTLTASLARAMARAGLRVAAVDGDLRESMLHEALDVPSGEGLCEYLAGTAELDAILRRGSDGVDVIVAGEVEHDPTQLLRAPRLSLLLDGLRERYDIVLVDSPPLLAVADPRAIAPLADGCVLLVQWLRTRRELVAIARDRLLEADARLLGVVLNRVKGQPDAAYGYGYGYRRRT